MASKSSVDRSKRHSHRQPDFLKCHLRGYQSSGSVQKPLQTSPLTPIGPGEKLPPVQQSDLLRSFYDDIMNNGLKPTANNWPKTPSKVSHDKDDSEADSNEDIPIDADVIIVGAGMAGLVAAYELTRANVSVLLLEQTDRVGGRVLTYGEENGLAKGLYGEAGAMRLPGEATTEVDKMIHFLTAHYVDLFELPKVPFFNSDENAFYSFYGEERKKAKDWTQADFDALWPDWSANIKPEYAQAISSIDDYYDHTTAVVTNQLRKWLEKAGDDNAKAADAWNRWIDIWSQFSFDGFLQSTYEAIITKIPETEDREGLEDLQYLLPWPNIALTGYSVFSYTQQLDQSLVHYLRGQLGQWGSPIMHCIDGGMSKLPEAFASSTPDPDEESLQSKVRTNRTVNVINYTFNPTNPGEDRVNVSGYLTNEKTSSFAVTGRAVIVTTGLNILRLITFKSEDNPPPKEFYQAIEDIFMAASTKIFIQTKRRFWEDDGIMGGFSKTNLPVGQIHYSRTDGITTKGLLLVYTWKTEALMFGSIDPETATKVAIEQIATIHPEIYKEYDNKGIVHAWYNQPNTQGAYGLLKPIQFKNIKWLWRPMFNVFFAGEGLSTSAGWIQGALESGLNAAYLCYTNYESVIEKSNSKNS